MTPKQITKKREKVVETRRKLNVMMRELTDDIMRELETLVKENNGIIVFARPVRFDKFGWSVVGYSIVWREYTRWNEEAGCDECHYQLCLDKKTNRGALGIPCYSGIPEQDTLWPLEYWSKSGTKTGILFHLYQEVINTLDNNHK